MPSSPNLQTTYIRSIWANYNPRPIRHNFTILWPPWVMHMRDRMAVANWRDGEKGRRQGIRSQDGTTAVVFPNAHGPGWFLRLRSKWSHRFHVRNDFLLFPLFLRWINTAPHEQSLIIRLAYSKVKERNRDIINRRSNHGGICFVNLWVP